VGGDEAYAPGRAAVESGDQQADRLHRKTIRRALAAGVPPRYVRAPAGSKLDPFKDWISEQLRADPAIQSLRGTAKARSTPVVAGRPSSSPASVRQILT
jgi:hypothetical protein